MRRLLLALSIVGLLLAQDSKYKPDGEILPGPPSPGNFREWLADILHWRQERLIRIGYDGSQYRRPEFQWTQSDFVQPQMMCEERYFYDPVERRYTVDRYLDDLDRRYCGIDSVLIWPVYPNIGIDSRSQYDLLQDLPGGIPGIRRMIDVPCGEWFWGLGCSPLGAVSAFSVPERQGGQAEPPPPAPTQLYRCDATLLVAG